MTYSTGVPAVLQCVDSSIDEYLRSGRLHFVSIFVAVG
jgi:hypothetical protein